MSEKLDTFDNRILDLLQNDATLSMDKLSEAVALSRNACWRRVRRLEDEGYIKKRVALLSAEKLDCALTAIILIKAAAHDADWLQKFEIAVQTLAEITEAHRLAGDVDYILKVRLSDMAAYDRLYKELTKRVPLLDISASFVMENIKDTTALPLPY